MAADTLTRPLSSDTWARTSQELITRVQKERQAEYALFDGEVFALFDAKHSFQANVRFWSAGPEMNSGRMSEKSRREFFQRCPAKSARPVIGEWKCARLLGGGGGRDRENTSNTKEGWKEEKEDTKVGKQIHTTPRCARTLPFRPTTVMFLTGFDSTKWHTRPFCVCLRDGLSCVRVCVLRSSPLPGLRSRCVLLSGRACCLLGAVACCWLCPCCVGVLMLL